jgi:lipopolysaccharide export system ATP-binding protein
MKLRTENIKKSYKGRQVVKGVSVEVNQGEIVGLLGPNGAGKTTSFYMMVGLVRPNEGHVYLDDIDITRHAMYKRAQLGIGYLPQEVSVFRKMSVEDNIMTVLELTDLNKEERHAKMESLLDEFGLAHVRKNLGQSLSGGEKRRTEIARALATDPKFILLDEPFAGVDPIAVEDIQRIVSKLKKRNIGVLITDHNVQETLSITDRAYLLFEGSILKEGTAEALAADEMVRKVYLGANFELRRKNYDLDSDGQKDLNDVRTAAEKNIAYVDNVLNIAKITRGKIENESKLGYHPTFTESTGVDNLVQLVREMKTYLGKDLHGKRTTETYNAINFGPTAKYGTSSFLFGLGQVGAIIPFYGWYLSYRYYRRRRVCINDLEALISHLESFKHLLEHPEIEDMI